MARIIGWMLLMIKAFINPILPLNFHTDINYAQLFRRFEKKLKGVERLKQFNDIGIRQVNCLTIIESIPMMIENLKLSCPLDFSADCMNLRLIRQFAGILKGYDYG